jgi:hypothetical protein
LFHCQVSKETEGCALDSKLKIAKNLYANRLQQLGISVKPSQTPRQFTITLPHKLTDSGLLVAVGDFLPKEQVFSKAASKSINFQC